MPHDKNGNILNIGDTVVIPCVVTSVSVGEEYCNVSLATKIPMPPYTEPSNLTLNTKQVVKVFGNEVELDAK